MPASKIPHNPSSVDGSTVQGYESFRYNLCLSIRSSNHIILPWQNVADIKKLKSVGICTIKGIQMTTKRALCNVKGLSEAKVEKIKEAANKLIVSKINCSQLRIYYVFSDPLGISH